MTSLLFLILGIAFVVAPFAARAFGYPLGMIEGALLTGFGTSILVVTGVMAVVTRLYQKAKACEAFVRTGLGGVRVIRDGGALVIPFVHELAAGFAGHAAPRGAA